MALVGSRLAGIVLEDFVGKWEPKHFILSIGESTWCAPSPEMHAPSLVLMLAPDPCLTIILEGASGPNPSQDVMLPLAGGDFMAIYWLHILLGSLIVTVMISRVSVGGSLLSACMHAVSKNSGDFYSIGCSASELIDKCHSWLF